jgi:hypothetical protein
MGIDVCGVCNDTSMGQSQSCDMKWKVRAQVTVLEDDTVSLQIVPWATDCMNSTMHQRDLDALNLPKPEVRRPLMEPPQDPSAVKDVYVRICCDRDEKNVNGGVKGSETKVRLVVLVPKTVEQLQEERMSRALL